MAANDKIEIFSGGAIAKQGQHQVIFADNLNTAGAIDQQTLDGRRLRSNILGLMYLDTATGNAVVIARLHDSAGELIAENQILYPDTFEGVKADVRYTYRRDGFEQDVILREQPPAPEFYGLNSESTELEVFTEFINPPTASVTDGEAYESGLEPDQKISWGATSLDRGKAFSLEDNGSAVSVAKRYVTIQGRHFLLEKVRVKDIKQSLSKLPEQASNAHKLPFLVSKNPLFPPVPLAKVASKPIQLAAATAPNQGYVLDYVQINSDQTNFTFQGDVTYYVSGNFNISGTTIIEGGTVVKYDASMGVASSVRVLGTLDCQTASYHPAVFTTANDNTVGEAVPPSSTAPCTGNLNFQVVNEYSGDLLVYLYDESNWNWVFGGNATAYATSSFNFTVGLGGLYYVDVIDNDSGNQYTYDINTTLNNGTLTLASDGWSTPEISYSENGTNLCTPGGLPTITGLFLANGGIVHDVRFANCSFGISSADNYSVTDAQFINCDKAFDTENASLYAGNILLSHIGTAFYGRYFHAVAEQMTYDQGTNMTDDPVWGTDTNSTVALTNSLVTAVANYGVVPVSTNHVVNLASNLGVYQTVGGGSYYLTNGSPYRNYGTSGINPALRAELSQKTTYPPTVFAKQLIVTNLALASTVTRDTNSNPDLGYHYAPLDYVFGGCDLFANLTFTAGTAVSFYEDYGSVNSSGQPYGLSINDGATFTTAGTSTQPCWIVQSRTAQEGVNGNWTPQGWMGPIMINGSGSGILPQLNSRFTTWSHISANGSYFRDNWDYGVVNIANSEFWCGGIALYAPSIYFTNCIFNRTYALIYGDRDSDNVTYLNSTFYNGMLFLKRYSYRSTSFWQVENCTFDGTMLITYDQFNAATNFTLMDYNSYSLTNNSWTTYPFSWYGASNTNRLEVVGPHDLMLTNGYNWQSSWLGNFYLPSNSRLINAGYTNANLLGLYHFTTQTNQTKEANSVADIGHHYVATDVYGNILDSNGNGTPDYIEDANGNGLVDNGETAWMPPPVILIQPANQLVNQGSNTTLFVVATNLTSLNYQWSVNGTNISGATNYQLNLNNITLSQAGAYSVVVSNSAGSIISSQAVLTVVSVVVVLTGSPMFRDIAYDRIANLYDAGYGCISNNQNIVSVIGTMSLQLPSLGSNVVMVCCSFSNSASGIQAIQSATLKVPTAQATGSNVNRSANLALSDFFLSTYSLYDAQFDHAQLGVVPYVLARNNALVGIDNMTYSKMIFLTYSSGIYPYSEQPPVSSIYFGGTNSLPIYLIANENIDVMRALVLLLPNKYINDLLLWTTNDLGQYLDLDCYFPSTLTAGEYSHYDNSSGTYNDVFLSNGSACGIIQSNPDAIGFLGVKDFNTISTNATAVSWNGVAYSSTNVANGSYPLWGYEHIFNKPNSLTSNQQTVRDALIGAMTNSAYQAGAAYSSRFIPLTNMQVDRVIDGGLIAPHQF